jgi:Skp family chaperone for outer membrane proteins
MAASATVFSYLPLSVRPPESGQSNERGGFMTRIFAALLGLSVAFALSATVVNAQETTEQKVERLKREGKEYLDKKAKEAAEAKEELKAKIADVKSKYDTKEKRQAAIAEARQKFAETKARLEKAHTEKCTAVRTDCTALYPDSRLKNRACRLWHGCYR